MDEIFSWFVCRLHDFDNNTKLDGLEILAAISHAMGYEADKSKNAEAAAEDRNIYYAGKHFSLCHNNKLTNCCPVENHW